MTYISSEELDAMEARASAATPAPWVTNFGVHGDPIIHEEGAPRTGEVARISPAPGDYGKNNAVFIAHARADVPKLVARVRFLEAVVQRALDALDEEDTEDESL